MNTLTSFLVTAITAGKIRLLMFNIRKAFMTNTGAVISKLFLLLFSVVLIQGCASLQTIGRAIDAYEAQIHRVALGQSKESVLSILSPTQSMLSTTQVKPPEQYKEDEKLMEVYFFRSRSFPDGLVTDDEFTPYVFEDGILVAIGWTAIGGPKTQAQRRDDDDFHFHGRTIFHY